MIVGLKNLSQSQSCYPNSTSVSRFFEVVFLSFLRLGFVVVAGGSRVGGALGAVAGAPRMLLVLLGVAGALDCGWCSMDIVAALWVWLVLCALWLVQVVRFGHWKADVGGLWGIRVCL